MPTSGTHNFDPTFDDILQDAAGMVGGEPILAEEIASARRGLDTLLTKIQNRNLLLHKIQTSVIPTVVSVGTYTLNNSVLDVLVISAERTSGGGEITLSRMGYQQWAERPAADQLGQPLRYWFNRGRVSSTLHLWPIPDAVYNLNITLQKTTEDTVRAFDNVDVPRRFIPALTFGLAYWIGLRRMNRVPPDRLALLRNEFNEAVREAMDEDRERASVRIKLGW